MAIKLPQSAATSATPKAQAKGPAKAAKGKAKAAAAAFAPLGRFEGKDGAQTNAYGCKAMVDTASQTLLIQVPFGEAALAKAPLSSSGKSLLVGNTGGWVDVPGTNPPLRISLCAGITVADLRKAGMIDE